MIAFGCGSCGRKFLSIYFPTSILLECSGISNPNEELLQAAKSGNRSWAQFLLQCNETEINTGDTEQDYLGNTPLIWASKNGHSELVELLLDQPLLDVNKLSLNKDDGNALMVASYNGNTRIVNLLLRHAQINVNLEDVAEGRTALFYATSKHNSPENIIQQLLEVPHIDINKANKNGETALIHATFHGNAKIVEILLSHKNIDVNTADTTGGKTALFTASRKDDLKVVWLLLDHPMIDVNKAEAGEGLTALMMASKHGFTDIVRELLEQPQIDVNKCSINRDTPLMVATNGSYTSIVKMLLAFATVDVNFATFEGKTALRYSTDSIDETIRYIQEGSYHRESDVPLENKTAILGLILRCPSTDTNVLDEEYKTALDYAKEKNTSEITDIFKSRGIDTIKNGHTCCSDKVNDGLQKAAGDGDLTMTKAFLQCHQVNVNQGYKYGMTPLFVASRENHVSVVQLLLEDTRTDVNRVVNNVNALWDASNIGNTNSVKLLINHPKIDINQMNTRDKTTPLIIASKRGHRDIVELLLRHTQIEVNRKDSYGDTALLKATWRSYLKIVKLFLRCSATIIPYDYRNELEDSGKKEIIEAIDWWATLAKMSATCCLNVNEDLITAANAGDFRAIRGLLLCPNSDINVVDNRGRTPLYLSAWKGHIQAVEVLLADSKNEVNQGTTSDGQTAFSIASQEGHLIVMKILLQDNRTDANVGWCGRSWAVYKHNCQPIRRNTSLLASPTVFEPGIEVNKK